MQRQYQNLIDTKSLTKKAMCDLCVPFRDEYGLTDLQTLMIARNEIGIPEIIDFIKVIMDKGYAKPYLTDPRKLYQIGVNFSSETGTIEEFEYV